MSITFPKLRNISMRSQVVYEIESKIFSGALKPGDRLPPERDLAAAMGVSRSLVNLAILDLEAKGFLRVIPRKGTFVTDYKKESTPQMLLSLINHSSEITDHGFFTSLSEMRILLESECAKLAAVNATDDNLAELEKAIVEMKSSLGKDRNKFMHANFRFHYEVCNASGNIIYAMIFKSFEQALLYYLPKIFNNDERCTTSIKQHEILLGALRSRNADRSEQATMAIMHSGIGVLEQLFEDKES